MSFIFNGEIYPLSTVSDIKNIPLHMEDIVEMRFQKTLDNLLSNDSYIINMYAIHTPTDSFFEHDGEICSIESELSLEEWMCSIRDTYS